MNRRRFVLATALGQAASALVTSPLALLAASLAAEQPDDVDPRWLALVMIAAGAIEGAITASAQSVALGTRAPRRAFVARSTAGFAIAWGVGVVSSYLEPALAAGPASRALVLCVAALQGLVLGLVVGASTAPLLFDRPAVRARVRFVAASALGWSAALVLAAIVADLATASSIGGELVASALRALLVGSCAASVIAAALPPGED